MTQPLTPALELHRNRLRDEWPWIWLYAVRLPTSPVSWIRITNALQPVEFGRDSAGARVLWTPFPVTHDQVRETNSGDLPTINVQVGNPTLEIARLIDTYGGLTGQKAVIRLVNMVDLLDTRSQIEVHAEVQRARVTAKTCTFSLSSYDLYKRKFPRWRYLSFSCRWQFGSPECGYSIPASPGETVGTGFSTCNRTFEACGDRGDDEEARGVTRLHPKRMGWWPGIPRSVGGV